MKRIKVYDTVALALPDEVRLRDSSFACRVIAIVGTTVALEPLQKENAVALPERVPDALMVFRHENALIALKGVLLQKGSVGDLRFKVTDDVSHAKASRLQICLPIALRLAGSEDEEVQGLTADLSADGLVVECPIEAGIGTQLEATLSLPGSDDPIQTVLTVAECFAGRLDLELSRADRDARGRLARFVLEQNRAILHRDQLESDDLDF